MNPGIDTSRSTSSSQHQIERPTMTIKQPQKEQIASRVGIYTTDRSTALVPVLLLLCG